MKKNMGNLLALYPTPLVVVGAMVDGKPNWLLVGHLGIIGHDHVRLHVFCHLILLTAGKRRQSRYMLLSYRKNCKEAPHPAPAGPMKIFPGASPAAGRGTGPEAPG